MECVERRNTIGKTKQNRETLKTSRSRYIIVVLADLLSRRMARRRLWCLAIRFFFNKKNLERNFIIVIYPSSAEIGTLITVNKNQYSNTPDKDEEKLVNVCRRGCDVIRQLVTRPLYQKLWSLVTNSQITSHSFW